MRFDLQRAPSAACIEQRADLFDHRVGRPDDEDMINEEFKIGLERIDACILGKAVHHAEAPPDRDQVAVEAVADRRSEEHTSELQSLMRSSYAVFCLKKKTN